MSSGERAFGELFGGSRVFGQPGKDIELPRIRSEVLRTPFKKLSQELMHCWLPPGG